MEWITNASYIIHGNKMTTNPHHFEQPPSTGGTEISSEEMIEVERSIEKGLREIFAKAENDEELQQAVISTAKLLDAKEASGHFIAAVNAVKQHVSSGPRHEIIVFGLLCRVALNPVSNAQKALNIDMIDFVPSELTDRSIQNNRVKLACKLGGPLVQLCANRPDVAKKATDLILAIAGDQDDLAWREIGHATRESFIRNHRPASLPQDTFDRLPFSFWVEAKRNFKAGTLNRDTLSESLIKRAGADIALQGQCVASAWTSVDEKEILKMRAAFPSFGLEESIAAIERESTQSPYLLESLARNSNHSKYSQPLYIQNTVTSCQGKYTSAPGQWKSILTFPSPLPEQFYRNFFMVFAQNFEEHLKNKNDQKLRKEKERVESDALLMKKIRNVKSLTPLNKPYDKSFRTPPKYTEPSPEPQKTPAELRGIFMKANPDIKGRIEKAELNDENRKRNVRWVSELKSLDEPSRGYPLGGQKYEEKPSLRKIASGYQAMLAKHKNDIARLNKHFHVGKTPGKSAPRGDADRLTWPASTPVENAFTLPARQLLQLDQASSQRKIIGRIQQELDRNELHIENFVDFSTACRAFAYAGGYRPRNGTKPTSRRNP